MDQSVLIMGGSGQAGAGTAALLRRWYPALPLTVAGRDLERAGRVAADLGNATPATLDLRRADLGLPPEPGFTAVVAAVRDSHLNGLRFAQDHGVPYLSISNGLVDITPEVIAGAQRTTAAPILLASHFLAGLVVLAAMDAARDFERVDTIRVAAVLDEHDAGGPAALEDLERLMEVTSAGLIRRDGVFTWATGTAAQVDVPSLDGSVLPGQTIATLDVPSLALATGAPNVRFDFAVGESTGRRRGDAPSLEIHLELRGTSSAGTPLSTRQWLVHPEGQRPLTALGIALGVERLLGLRGAPVPPGLYTPEALIEPSYAAERMTELGTLRLQGEEVSAPAAR
ncbi:hypothetical protein [Nonomuraea sp. NPDC050310]|uniref:hypothetical protein n=1 Tax=Nonomuraea sp. NPDC050310 TaxID=3154935 RepID=UPI0033DD94C9